MFVVHGRFESAANGIGWLDRRCSSCPFTNIDVVIAKRRLRRFSVFPIPIPKAVPPAMEKTSAGWSPDQTSSLKAVDGTPMIMVRHLRNRRRRRLPRPAMIRPAPPSRPPPPKHHPPLSRHPPRTAIQGPVIKQRRPSEACRFFKTQELLASVKAVHKIRPEQSPGHHHGPHYEVRMNTHRAVFEDAQHISSDELEKTRGKKWVK